MSKKLRFYTEWSLAKNAWQGKCREDKSLVYTAGYGRTRDAALSGVKRMAKRAVPTIVNNYASPPTSTKRKVNRIMFVIDRSGSMGGLEDAVVRSFNKSLESLYDEAVKAGQRVEAGVITFDDQITLVTPLSTTRPVLSREQIYARGSTALWDAMGQAIQRLEDVPVMTNDDVSYLVVTLTDGQENISKRFTASTLRALIERLQGTDRWTFACMGPRGCAAHFSLVGIHAGNITDWEQSVRGTYAASVATNSGFTRYTAARNAGLTSMKDFYVTDLSNLTKAQVVGALDDIKGQVKIWNVDKEDRIRDFCERKSGSTFLRGAAFYALTKEEKAIQPYKQILIVEKGKGSVYGGAQARQLLGLPAGKTVKVRPGNHANWDIYVQSTSVNRFLVRGTNVIYYPAVGVFPSKKSSARSSARAKR